MPAAIFVGLILLVVLGLLVAMSFQPASGIRIELPFVTSSWAWVLSSPYDALILSNSLRLAATITFWALLLSYPIAWLLTRVRPLVLTGALFLLVIPLLFSSVARATGWTLLLLPGGLVANLLPVSVLYTEAAVVITIVHAILPFAVFPIYSAMRDVPRNVLEASRDLGASSFRTFVMVLFPLTLRGTIAAAQLVFTLSLGSYAIPRLMGGGRVNVLTLEIYNNLDLMRWPISAAEALVLVVVAVSVVAVLSVLGVLLDWRRSTSGREV